jgi:hypothetical protein
MSTKDKLIERCERQPKDFTWEELVRLFGIFGFAVDNRGKTSGSRTRFKSDDYVFYAHKPHPSHVIKESLLKKASDYLKNNGFIIK